MKFKEFKKASCNLIALQYIGRSAYTHQVSGLVIGQYAVDYLHHLIHRLRRFPYRKPTYGVPVGILAGYVFCRLAPKVGILASLHYGKQALLVAIQRLGFLKHKDNYLLIEGEEGDTLDFTIRNNVEEATGAAHKAVAFCEENGVEANLAHNIGVAVEELCVNSATYAAKGQTDSIDIFVKVSEQNVVLRLRDNGNIFNPTKYVDDSGREVTGLKLVRSLTSLIEYNRVLDYNVTVVTVNR